MKEKKYIIGNSVRHLNAQREYFLHPERQYKQSLCGFFKSIFVEANGDVFMCMKDKPIGNINDLDFDAGKFRRIIKAEQKKIMNCSVINCHFDLNCRFN